MWKFSTKLGLSLLQSFFQAPNSSLSLIKIIAIFEMELKLYYSSVCAYSVVT